MNSQDQLLGKAITGPVKQRFCMATSLGAPLLAAAWALLQSVELQVKLGGIRESHLAIQGFCGGEAAGRLEHDAGLKIGSCFERYQRRPGR